MYKEYVIIGGGVAGLAASIRLAELGAKPLVIEGGKYPAHKVCGEFLSPDCVPKLAEWNIPVLQLNQMHFHFAGKQIPFNFPTKAGSLSHLQLDPQLAARAADLGAEILTGEKVESLEAGYKVVLSSGKVVYADNLIIATGRIPSFTQKVTQFPYVGIKAHFEGVKMGKTLEMFLRAGSYMGVSPIEEGKFNVAALVRADLINYSPGQFMNEWLQSESLFKNAKPCFEWMVTPVPEFGIKKIPPWKHAYFIGDAAATIPPITGNGLGLSIRSGTLAAEYALKQDWQGFRKVWKKEFTSSIYWGCLLHHAALSPTACKFLLKSCQWHPALISYFYHFTRKKELA